MSWIQYNLNYAAVKITLIFCNSVETEAFVRDKMPNANPMIWLSNLYLDACTSIFIVNNNASKSKDSD